MAANFLLTPTIVANELLRRFKNNLAFASGASHPYDGAFSKIGDTYTLREPVRFAAVKSATYSAQNVVETSIPLTITTQAHAGFEFTSKDMTLTIDRFSDRYLASAAAALSNAFEVDGLTMAYQSTYNLVGTPGSTPNLLKTYLQAGSMLDNASAPVDDQRSIVMSPAAQVEIVDALKGLFQSTNEIKKQYLTGRMGTAAGADWSMSQNIRTHTVGPQGGAPLVDGANQSGGTLAMKGWTAAAALRLKKGDVFQIAGVYAVNPVSGDTLANLQNFVVTADFSSDATGKGGIQIDPDIVLTGPTKNVSAAPADSAPITVIGNPGTLSPQNLLYHSDAFCYAMVSLEEPKGVHMAKTVTDEDTGLSIRMVSDYDIANDKFITRADIMYGWAARRPGWACRICG